MTKKIEYNNSSFTIRFEFPYSWDAENISAVNISVADLDGNALLAATATSLWETKNVYLADAVDEDDTSIVVETDDVSGTFNALSEGDRIRIVESAEGPAEDVEVQYWISASDTATLAEELRYDHAADSTVHGLFCTYDLDTSDTDDFGLSDKVVITWSPQGTDDFDLTEVYSVVTFAMQYPGFSKELQAVHPREYDVLNRDGRLGTVLELAITRLKNELMLRHFNLERLVDTSLALPCLAEGVRRLVLLNADESQEDERKICEREYKRQFELLCHQHVYTDDDQDGAKDTDEVSIYPATFARGH